MLSPSIVKVGICTINPGMSSEVLQLRASVLVFESYPIGAAGSKELVRPWMSDLIRFACII